MRTFFIVLCILSVVAAAGCASAHWQTDILEDPRLVHCRGGGEPMAMTLAVAPVSALEQEPHDPQAAPERFPISAVTQDIRESLTGSIVQFNLFSEVGPLEVAQKSRGAEAMMEAAWEQDRDLLLTLDIQKFEAFYDGVNGLYVPNIINWLFLLVPSWWVKDEVYGARITAEAKLHSVRSGRLLYRKELTGEFRRSLNDFQRGWQLAGIFRVPGSLRESNWRRISQRVTPGVLREVEVQIIDGLTREFRAAAAQPDFERLLETRLALVVGVSRHKDYNIPKLKYTEEDATSIREFLTDPEGGHAPARNCLILTDEHASRERILESLDFLAKKSSSRDSVVIYFAGYGASVAQESEDGDENAGAKMYLVPYDANSRDIPGTCIPIEEIEEKIAKIEARELLVILDCGFGGELETRTLAAGGQPSKPFSQLLSQPGRRLLRSAKPDEGAMEIADHRHGVFTFYLLEGLKGPADADKDGAITLGELCKYANTRVVEETEMEASAQHPQLKGDASEMTIKGTR